MKIVHSADLHFSADPVRLSEVVTVTDAILDHVSACKADCLVLAGDTVDEYVKRITVNSDVWRAVRKFLREAADLCPVLVVRGTPSHDQRTPEAFRDISDKIFVACDPCQVALVAGNWHNCVTSIRSYHQFHHSVALFSCLPSPDRALLAGGSLSDTSANVRLSVEEQCREFAAAVVPGVPHILVAHGMLDGASMGSYIPAEDQEFSLEAFRLAKPTYVALGHIHASQEFQCLDESGEIAFPAVYPGSPGRLNFGETDAKGFHVVEFSGGSCRYHQVPVPARNLATVDFDCSGDFLAMNDYLSSVALSGEEIKFRVTVPEDQREYVDRDAISKTLLSAGAKCVRVEVNVIPVVRSRSAGISSVPGLPEKLDRWGVCSETVVTDDMRSVSGRIGGVSAEEIIDGL